MTDVKGAENARLVEKENKEEYVISAKDKDGKIKPRYIRKGQCNRCGWCCEYHGCPHLQYDGGGKAVCPIYKNRPKRCRVFPEAPPILHEGCGYYFIDTWDNNRIVKFGKDL